MTNALLTSAFVIPLQFVGVASGCGTSGDTDAKVQNGVGSSDVEPSSSEQSADTVIYVGPSEETDGEHPPVHIPSLSAVQDGRCHPMLNKLLAREPGQSRSVPSSPQRSASANRGTVGPRNREGLGTGRPNGSSSARSSPVRNPKPTAATGRKEQQRAQGAEERWIDGPRVSKSRAHSARAMLMAAKRGGGGVDDGTTGGKAAGETWIDGPMHANSGGQHANVYGFMDYHKKNMIKKWVEHQVYQVTDKQNRRDRSEPRDGYSSYRVDELGPRGRASGQEENGDEEVPKCDSMLPVPPRTMIENNDRRVGRGNFCSVIDRARNQKSECFIFGFLGLLSILNTSFLSSI